MQKLKSEGVFEQPELRKKMFALGLRNEQMVVLHLILKAETICRESFQGKKRQILDLREQNSPWHCVGVSVPKEAPGWGIKPFICLEPTNIHRSICLRAASQIHYLLFLLMVFLGRELQLVS